MIATPNDQEVYMLSISPLKIKQKALHWQMYILQKQNLGMQKGS